MIDLVRKRHEGEAWQVFSELANGTGYRVRGWADAAALGMWPSRGYEFHGYEFKISREDLKKELRDPSKADNVGKYCDFWWLCLEKEELAEGLVIPETWGILVPQQRGGGRILRVVRKAPKLEAKPFDRAFCAAMIRNVTKTWVPKHEYTELKETAYAKAREDYERDRKFGNTADTELARLRETVKLFEEASGVKLTSSMWHDTGDIGEAVQLVLNARDVVRSNAIERARNRLKHQLLIQEGLVRDVRRAMDALDAVESGERKQSIVEHDSKAAS